jgi:phosphopantothenate-cysteine ligase/phosphopantothenoylcysteine decarboxylase/phosphopantothenate--cysteine ligase
MKILVTAGATQTPIDQVRAITNIFKGKTGTYLASGLAYMDQSGLADFVPKSPCHQVTLLTSNPDIITERFNLRVVPYRTFDDLAARMEEEIRDGGYDVVIHSAAVSDYKVARVLVQDPIAMDFALTPIDATKKVSGSHDRMYLELVPTFKIVDRIRKDWGFKGFLVKFKLQVGVTDDELLDIARKSRATSDADLIVANCLEWAKEYAYVVGRDDVAEKVTRGLIGAACLQAMQKFPS